MAEPLPEPIEPAQPAVDPVEAERELAHRNLVWGWALFGLFCALFGGTVLIALAYLWLD
jgi:hypothetical protein